MGGTRLIRSRYYCDFFVRELVARVHILKNCMVPESYSAVVNATKGRNAEIHTVHIFKVKSNSYRTEIKYSETDLIDVSNHIFFQNCSSN